MISDSAIARHRTAIRRYRLSRPVALALDHGLITAGRSFFDYGCGYGGDFQLLQQRGIRASGWDPYHRPQTQPEGTDVINLGYVLNIIEDPGERATALRRAFRLAKQMLIVAVRVDHALNEPDEFGDGYLTSWGSFQKIYTQSDFCAYLESTLGVRPHMAGLGIAFVIKDPQIESSYLASLAFGRRLQSREDLYQAFAQNATAQRLVAVARGLGRFPLVSEFPELHDLTETFGPLGRVEKLTLRVIDPAVLAGSREQRRDDILTYLSMIELQGLKPPRFRSLPAEVQADFKALWPTYSAAVAEGREFLFRIGKPEVVQQACLSSPVGKLLPGHVYIHRSSEDSLPAVLRILIFAARNLVGEVEHNVLKISIDGRKVSFLNYPEFDRVAHPELRSSVKVYLPTTSYSIRDYSDFENPPILHRKEQFVCCSYPCYEKFQKLTRQEEDLGLLSAPDIGYKKQWTELLKERNIWIDDHEIRAASVA